MKVLVGIRGISQIPNIYISHINKLRSALACLGCKGSLVQIQSRRPTNPNLISNLQAIIHKQYKSLKSIQLRPRLRSMLRGRGNSWTGLNLSITENKFSFKYFSSSRPGIGELVTSYKGAVK